MEYLTGMFAGIAIGIAVVVIAACVMAAKDKGKDGHDGR